MDIPVIEISRKEGNATKAAITKFTSTHHRVPKTESF